MSKKHLARNHGIVDSVYALGGMTQRLRKVRSTAQPLRKVVYTQHSYWECVGHDTRQPLAGSWLTLLLVIGRAQASGWLALLLLVAGLIPTC